jgi:uncharacterized protein
MMSILQQIRADKLAARKSGDSLRSGLLITLDSEASKVGKDKENRESSDEEVVLVIRKFLKGLEETSEALKKAGRPTEQQDSEKAILMSYLPKQLTTEELAAVIATLVGQLPEKKPDQLGKIMASLKAQYTGLYDGKSASELIKKALQG